MTAGETGGYGWSMAETSSAPNAGLDIDGLLRDISPEKPCGEDLRHDLAYLELQQMVVGTPERVVGDDERFRKPAQDPEWSKVRDRCLALLGRSKDLRLFFFLCLASVRLEGLEGLRAGLALLQGILEHHWDQVHPMLDPKEGNDPRVRLNVLSALAQPPGSMSDPYRFQERVRAIPLVRSGSVSFSWHDALVARGDLTPVGTSAAGRADLAAIAEAAAQNKTEDLRRAREALAAAIHAALDGADMAELHQEAEALTVAIDQVKAIEATVAQRVDAEHALSLENLRLLLGAMRDWLGKPLAERGRLVATPEGATAGAPTAQAAATGVSMGGNGIGSDEDVLRVLGQVCEYYDRHEPSSPVPLLLRRAQRLVRKTFVDIVRDLVPDALGQIEKLGGTDKPPETR